MIKIANYFFLIYLSFFFAVISLATEKTVVYWGTFDPPTLAHEEIVKDLAQDKTVKKIILVVNNHGHKQYKTDGKTRMEMMGLLIQDFKNKIDLRLKDDPKDFTYSTMKKEIGETLALAVGEDSFWEFCKRKEAKFLNEYDSLYVYHRNFQEKKDEKGIEGKLQELKCYDEKVFSQKVILKDNGKWRDISSTKAREHIQQKGYEGLASYLPQKIISYIKEHQLYQKK